MLKAPNSTPLTEPIIVDCTYVTGTAIISDEHVFQIVGWTEMPRLSGSQTEERRIVVRFAMSAPAARELCDDLKSRLSTRERRGNGCVVSDELLSKVN